MAFNATTSTPLVLDARAKLIAATQAMELFIQVKNPGLVAGTDAAMAAAVTAIAAVRA